MYAGGGHMPTGRGVPERATARCRAHTAPASSIREHHRPARPVDWRRGMRQAPIGASVVVADTVPTMAGVQGCSARMGRKGIARSRFVHSFPSPDAVLGRTPGWRSPVLGRGSAGRVGMPCGRRVVLVGHTYSHTQSGTLFRGRVRVFQRTCRGWPEPIRHRRPIWDRRTRRVSARNPGGAPISRCKTTLVFAK